MSTPSSSHTTDKTTQQSIAVEDSITEEVTEPVELVTEPVEQVTKPIISSTTSHPVKTATSFPTYSPIDDVSGISSDHDDDVKGSTDLATSTDSIPKQLKKLKLSEK